MDWKVDFLVRNSYLMKIALMARAEVVAWRRVRVFERQSRMWCFRVLWGRWRRVRLRRAAFFRWVERQSWNRFFRRVDWEVVVILW